MSSIATDWKLILAVRYDGVESVIHKYFNYNDTESVKKLVHAVMHTRMNNEIPLASVYFLCNGTDDKHSKEYPVFKSQSNWYRFVGQEKESKIIYGVYSNIMVKQATQALPCFLVPANNPYVNKLPNFFSLTPHLDASKQAILFREKDDKKSMVCFYNKYLI